MLHMFDTEDKWIVGTEGRVQKSLGLRRIDVHRPLVPFTEFHNETLCELIEPDKDFLNFKFQQGQEDEDDDSQFSFLTYSFVLQPQVKVEEMFFDNRVLMHKHRRRVAHQIAFVGGALESPFLTISVRRENAVADALGQLELIMKETPKDLKKQLRVTFDGEPGVDEGGPSKEFYQIIIEQLFNPDFGMFTLNPETRRYWFRAGSLDTEKELILIGCLFGLAIYNSIIVDVAFPLALYLKLLGKLPGFDHLRDLDPTLHQSLAQMLAYDGDDFDDVFCATFQVSYNDVFGDTVTNDLLPGGKDKPVTKENREEYVELYADYLLNQSVAEEFRAFRKGFLIVTHESCLGSLFGPEEIEMLVCGTTEFNLADLQTSTKYDNGYTEDAQVIKWFWEAVREMGETEQRQLLAFATGTDRVPLGGLSQLQFVIARNGDDSDRLPTAHTCFNILLLPEYASKERLSDRLLKAVLYSRGFGLQ